MRLIDADTLSEKLCETTIFIKDGEVRTDRYDSDLPDRRPGTVSCGSDLGMISAPDDGYCSFGERKEEDV